MVFFRFTNFIHDHDVLIGFDQINKIDTAQEIEKLLKKNWSKYKIQRFLKNKKKALEQNYTNRNPWHENFQRSYERWQRLFTKLLNITVIDYIGIIYHWYDSFIDLVKLEPISKVQKNMKNLTIDTLKTLRADELLYITT